MNVMLVIVEARTVEQGSQASAAHQHHARRTANHIAKVATRTPKARYAQWSKTSKEGARKAIICHALEVQVGLQ